MKNFLRIISFACSLFLFTTTAYAASYDIETMLVDASIQENGDMEIKELIVVNGNFTSFQRSLTYKDSRLESHEPPKIYDDAIYNGTGLKDVTVSYRKLAKEEIDYSLMEQTFTPFERTYYKEDALPYEYVESSIQDGKTITMYYNSQNERIAFLLTYTITDVVVLHTDTAEIYWPFLRNNFEEPIAQYKINLHLPCKLDEQTHYFIHGDITGNIEPIYPDSLEASFTKVSSNTDISLRVVFADTNLTEINETKQTNQENYNQIIALEEERFQTEKETYERTSRILNTVQSFCIGYLFFLGCWWLFVFFRYHFTLPRLKSIKYRNTKVNLSLPLIDVLMNNEVSYDAFCATLIQLIEKKNLKVTKLESDDYRLSLMSKKNLTYTEELMLDFLFEKIGANQTVTLNAFQRYLTAEKSSRTFANFYSNWTRCILKEADRQDFYEKNGLPIISSIFCLLLMIFVLFAGVYFKLNTILPWCGFVLTLLFCIYCFMIHKRTKYGQELYTNCLALKNFLQDFQKFSFKELPTPKTWASYYSYASLFGIGNSTYEAMINALTTKFIGVKKVKGELTTLNAVNEKIKYALLLNGRQMTK